MLAVSMVEMDLNLKTLLCFKCFKTDITLFYIITALLQGIA